ncbi:hypothetical protein TNCV_829701 [Trichonephila clavipes]|nr:hypothetical protein TNCV_829701 [Trichonephila clavipes]
MRSKTVLITREKVSTAQIPGNPVNKSFSKHLPRAGSKLMHLRLSKWRTLNSLTLGMRITWASFQIRGKIPKPRQTLKAYGEKRGMLSETV